MKTFTKRVLAVILVLTLKTGFFLPAFATSIPLEDMHSLTAEQLEEIAAFAEGLAAVIGVDMVTLTPEARDIALADLEYLFNKVMQLAPTQNIVYRRDIAAGMDALFAHYHQLIYNNIPMPSLIALDMGERWVVTPDNARYIAANYLYTILALLAFDLEMLGHMGPQPLAIIEQLFFGMALAMHSETLISQEALDLLLSQGVTQDEIDVMMKAAEQFVRLHYNAFSADSALWFYGIDPAGFDLDADISVVGFMNPDNVTTASIEPGRIAYVHIASFLNNVPLDAETLFPFFAEVQDYEHLIIDLRGNGGGFTHSFPTNVITQLIDESVTFTFAEFFIASELTAGFFENPHPMAGGLLNGVFPAGEFVQSQNLPQFNLNDLELLDYAMVWQVTYHPAENSTPFSGEIWLLVDGGTASTSEMAAKFSLLTGFATVVGEPTAGITQVTHTYVPLPYTGILFRIDLGYTIDQYGRSIEEFGVIPQIPNAAGLDALETLLSIIAPELFAVLAGANPFDEVPVKDIDGVAFVPLRLTADAFGWHIEWDESNNAAVLKDLHDNVWVIVVNENGVFNDNDRLYMPLEIAVQLFSS